MRKNIALALCFSLLAAGVLFSSLRVAALTERVRKLEKAQRVGRTADHVQQTRPAGRRPVPPDNSSHEVLRVVDGDTIEIDTDSGPLKVRVIGIDTPETVHPFEPKEPFGPEATARARELLAGQTVTIHYDPDPTHDTWGKYGRLLCYIELPDGRDFGLVMIQEGLAKAYPKYPFSRMSKYLASEQEARATKTGMWQVPTTQSTTAPAP